MDPGAIRTGPVVQRHGDHSPGAVWHCRLRLGCSQLDGADAPQWLGQRRGVHASTRLGRQHAVHRYRRAPATSSRLSARLESTPMDALATVLASASPATAINATALAIRVVDQQIAAIHFQQYSGFPGADPMTAATAAMQDAAGGWPSTKQAVLAAANAVIQGGPAAASLATGATTAAAIASAMASFRQG